MNDLLLKVLKRARVICWIYLILAFILKIFAFNDLFIHNHNYNQLSLIAYIDNNFIVYKMICFLFGFISIFLIMFCAIIEFRTYYKRVFLFSFLYSLILNIANEYILSEVIVLFSFSAYLFLLYYKCRISILLKVAIADIIFQSISFCIKNIGTEYTFENSVLVYIFMIDYYFMLLLYVINNVMKGGKSWQYSEWGYSYYLKKLKNYKKRLKNLKKSKFLKLIITKKFKHLLIVRKKKSKNLKRVILKIKYEKTIILKNYIVPFVFVFGISFFYAWTHDKVFELFSFVLTYGTIRYIFPKTFHADYIPNVTRSNVIWICNGLSTIMFCICVDLLKDISTSLFFGILVAIAVNYLLYLIVDYIDILKPERKLIDKCRRNGIMKEDDIKFVVQYKFYKISIKEQAKQLGYELQTVKNQRTKFNKLLNID